MPASQINFHVWPGAQFRIPGVYAEVDASQANTGTVIQKTLLIGQMTSSGTATAGTPIIASSWGDANTLFGVGSMLANMHQQYRITDAFGEVWWLPLADASGGAKASGTVTITGPATAAGTLNLYLAGVNLLVGVNNGDSATTIAGNINTTINNNVYLPVTSTASSGVVTITARHKGVAAGDCDIRMNYLGTGNGQYTPAGVGVAIVAMSGGTTDPDLATPLANLATQPFDYICCPYSGATDLGELETFFSDTTGRWSYLYELFGMAFSATRGNFSTLTTYGVTNNNQHVSVLGIPDSPTCIYRIAADYTAACAASLRVDPALPLQTVQMNWQAPAQSTLFTISERNTLLFDGVSTFTVDQAGVVHIERAITTWQTNAAGAPDTSYLNVETLATLTAVIRSIRIDLQTKFAQVKLVADGTRIPFGVSFVTAQTVAQEAIGQYNNLALQGIVQNAAIFAQNVQWQNQGNGQVALLLPVQLANQLRDIAMLVQFTTP